MTSSPSSLEGCFFLDLFLPSATSSYTHTLYIPFSLVEHNCVCSGGQRKRHVLRIRSGRDWRRRRILITSFCCSLLQHFVFTTVFVSCSIKTRVFASATHSTTQNVRSCASSRPLAPRLLCSRGWHFNWIEPILPALPQP